MENQGWPNPPDWLHRQSDAEFAELTEEEERILSEHGMTLEPTPEKVLDPQEQGRQQFLRLVTLGSFVEEEVARNLYQSSDTIRRWIDERRLFAIRHQDRWRIPKFQFAEEYSEIIPGIEEVNIRIPFDLHPIAIENWYHLPNPDLEIGEQSLSPLDWLRSRNDPQPLHQVAELLQYPSFQ